MSRRPLVALSVACALALPVASAPRTTTPSPSRPTLVVMLVIDQMRADYVQRYASRWRGGLRRLIDEGAWFQNAAYPYAYTVTCAGHATISTGRFPHSHGITGNSWWDAATGSTVECADDPAARSIGYDVPVRGGAVRAGKSAARLVGPAFTDMLRAQSGGAARVVTFSAKERTAIMLAGHGAATVTWYDASTGSLVTSSAYASAPVPFVNAFLKAHPIDADVRGTWTLRESPGTYLSVDSAAGERPPSFWTTVFPHPLLSEGAGAARPYEAWEESPFSDTYLERLGEAAIDALDLGRGPATDYLGISFSALDLVGHDFGPDSVEVEDVLLRLDDRLASLFAALDRRPGRSRYVVALTADHGVGPIPEQTIAHGLAAGRLRGPAMERITEALRAASGIADPVAKTSGGQIYLTREARAAFEQPARRQQAAAAAEQVPGVARVLFPGHPGWPASDTIARAVGYTWFPQRAGDVYVVQQPYWLFGDGSAASHGTPYPYDNWVPLFLLGSGIRAGNYTRAVTPADVAPTLAVLCGVSLPATDGRPLDEAMLAARPRSTNPDTDRRRGR